jgi:hypothetical protein
MTTTPKPDALAELFQRLEFDSHGYCPECSGWNVSPNGCTQRVHMAHCAWKSVIDTLPAKLAELVDACEPFDRLPHESIPDNVTIDFVCRAGQWRKLYTALRDLGR